jgi:hypothetical protein
MGTNIEDESKWNGACDKRSSCLGSDLERQSTYLIAARCVSMTPLGFPVEPEVYRI